MIYFNKFCYIWHRQILWKVNSFSFIIFEVVDKWYKGDVEKLDLDVLARFCYVLECGIDDIIEYKRFYSVSDLKRSFYGDYNLVNDYKKLYQRLDEIANK